MSSTPKVSVIIPAYNKAEETVRAVESVLAQTVPCECIVVDDGGDDLLGDRLYPHLHTHNNLIYIRQDNRGASAARNRGIAEAKGDYLAFLDCDDWYEPKKIEWSLGFDFCHTAAYMGDKIYGKGSGNLLLRNYICNSTVVVSRRAIKKVGMFNEDLFCAADWDLWLRLSEHYEPVYMTYPLTHYDV